MVLHGLAIAQPGTGIKSLRKQVSEADELRVRVEHRVAPAALDLIHGDVEDGQVEAEPREETPVPDARRWTSHRGGAKRSAEANALVECPGIRPVRLRQCERGAEHELPADREG